MRATREDVDLASRMLSDDPAVRTEADGEFLHRFEEQFHKYARMLLGGKVKGRRLCDLVRTLEGVSKETSRRKLAEFVVHSFIEDILGKSRRTMLQKVAAGIYDMQKNLYNQMRVHLLRKVRDLKKLEEFGASHPDPSQILYNPPSSQGCGPSAAQEAEVIQLLIDVWFAGLVGKARTDFLAVVVLYERLHMAGRALTTLNELKSVALPYGVGLAGWCERCQPWPANVASLSPQPGLPTIGQVWAGLAGKITALERVTDVDVAQVFGGIKVNTWQQWVRRAKDRSIELLGPSAAERYFPHWHSKWRMGKNS